MKRKSAERKWMCLIFSFLSTSQGYTYLSGFLLLSPSKHGIQTWLTFDESSWVDSDHIAANAISGTSKTGGTYIQRRRRPKRSDTDDDGLVSNVLSDFSESYGSRHQPSSQPSLHPCRTRMCWRRLPRSPSVNSVFVLGCFFPFANYGYSY